MIQLGNDYQTLESPWLQEIAPIFWENVPTRHKSWIKASPLPQYGFLLWYFSLNNAVPTFPQEEKKKKTIKAKRNKIEVSLVSLAVLGAVLRKISSDRADLFFTSPVPAALHFLSSNLRLVLISVSRWN